MLRKNIAILSLLSLTLVAVSAFAMEKDGEQTEESLEDYLLQREEYVKSHKKLDFLKENLNLFFVNLIKSTYGSEGLEFNLNNEVEKFRSILDKCAIYQLKLRQFSQSEPGILYPDLADEFEKNLVEICEFYKSDEFYNNIDFTFADGFKPTEISDISKLTTQVKTMTNLLINGLVSHYKKALLAAHKLAAHKIPLPTKESLELIKRTIPLYALEQILEMFIKDMLQSKFFGLKFDVYGKLEEISSSFEKCIIYQCALELKLELKLAEKFAKNVNFAIDKVFNHEYVEFTSKNSQITKDLVAKELNRLFDIFDFFYKTKTEIRVKLYFLEFTLKTCIKNIIESRINGLTFDLYYGFKKLKPNFRKCAIYQYELRKLRPERSEQFAKGVNSVIVRSCNYEYFEFTSENSQTTNMRDELATQKKTMFNIFDSYYKDITRKLLAKGVSKGVCKILTIKKTS